MNIFNFYKNSLIFFFLILGSCILSLILQKGFDFDFFVYHYYNGWAFLNNRLGIDFLPASFRTYFNPILDSITYYFIQLFNFHPYLLQFLNGLKLGIFLFLSYILADKIFINNNIDKKISVITVLLLTLMSPMLFICLGIDFNDITVCFLALISIILFLLELFQNQSFKRNFILFIASLIMGITVGLKYTAIIYVISLILCNLLNYKNIKKPINTLILILSGILIGFLISDGWWIYKIYQLYYNPFFPYFNNIFHSPFGNNSSVLIEDFGHIRPQNIFVFLFTPLLNTSPLHVAYEGDFFDFKNPLTFLSVVFFIIYKHLLKKELNTDSIINPKLLNSIIIIVVSAFYANQLLFGQFRYTLSLLPLCSIIIVVCCYAIAKINYVNKYCVTFIEQIPLIIFILYVTVTRSDATLLIIKICIYLFIIWFIYKIRFNNSMKLQNQGYCMTLLYILIFSTAIMSVNIYKLNSQPKIHRTLYIQDMNIEDNSIVLCGNITSNFVIPAQNPNAKYYIFGLQDKYYKELYQFMPKAIIVYNSYFLQDMMQEIFYQDNNHLYIILENRILGINIEFFNKIYQASIAEYSNGQVDMLSNCNKINYTIFNSVDARGEYLLCKLK